MKSQILREKLRVQYFAREDAETKQEIAMANAEIRRLLTPGAIGELIDCLAFLFYLAITPIIILIQSILVDGLVGYFSRVKDSWKRGFRMLLED